MAGGAPGGAPPGQATGSMTGDNRRLDILLLAGLIGLVVLPWYRIRSGFFGLGWIGDLPGKAELWPGAAQAVAGRWQLWPVLALFALAAWLRLAGQPGARGRALIWTGAAGLAWMLAEGLSVGLRGWNWGRLEPLFRDAAGQPASGAGAEVLALCFTGFVAFGLAER
jgi:iron(III) transport system permease protein